jgi:ribosomal protein L21E
MKKFTLPVAILVIISLLFSACAKKEYTLTIAANGQGTTNPSTGTYTYEDGKSLTISANPSSGWKFDGWSGDAAGNNAIISITMDVEKGITANFSKIPYTLTIAANGQGTTNPLAGARIYDAGTVVNITANPSSDWKFDSWSGDAAGTNTIVSIHMDGNKSVIANFSKITYILTMSVQGTGTTNPPAGARVYDAGTEVNITANPGTGWRFDSWSGDVAAPTSATTTVTMNSDKTVTANFSELPHNLTISVNGDGTTDPSPGTHTYAAGQVVNISAYPSSSWKFDSWSGDVAAPTSATTTVTMNSDKMVTANFSKASQDFGPYTFSISTGSGDWNISSIKMGDRVQFDFQAAGATVSYSVRDPNGNTILTGGGYVQFGGGSFVAATSGTYKLHFVSSEFSTLSVLRIRYIIYFAS